MSIELRVPELPESVADATILTWHKKAGDRVSRDETLLDLETDKVVLEVPAPEDGILKEIRFNAGDTVQTDDVLGIVEVGATPPAKQGEAESKAESMPVLTPAVRRLVKENGIEPNLIKGSGKNGRILKADVEAFIQEQTPPPAAENKKPPLQPSTPLLSIPGGERPEQRAPMTRLRKKVAERLLQAQQNAAILTTFNEVDLHEIKLLRSQYRETFETQYDVRLGYMSFFVKASVEALKRFPVVNASVDENDIIYHGYFDIGIAVSSPRGLVVPILRDADQLSFAEIEQQIRNFGEKAMAGTLSYDELTGGTFSITNGGVFGSMLSTPIINPPQSAILGMHAIQDRPVAENGEIVIRPMMYLALSYDHRIIDGKDAVQFLVNIKENLQACRDAQDAKRDVQVPLLPSLITTVISFCRSRPASGSLRQSIASSDQTSYPYLKWLNGVSDAYAASPLAQGTTGMLRAAYAYCGLPAFVSLSMAGSGGAGTANVAGVGEH